MAGIDRQKLRRCSAVQRAKRGVRDCGRRILRRGRLYHLFSGPPEMEADIRLELGELEEKGGRAGAAIGHYELVLELVRQNSPQYARAQKGLTRLE